MVNTGNSVVAIHPSHTTGRFVLIAHGTPEEATRAREILSHAQPETLEHHQQVFEAALRAFRCA
jgi:hypothetical protein